MSPRLSKVNWLAASVCVLLGIPAGVGSFAFYYGEGTSYFSNDPRACVNCHIMRDQYDGWQKASHHISATCVDCHLPDTFFAKYAAKASNGWHHSKAFTLQDFEEPIRIKEANAAILQANCARCHESTVHAIVSDSRAARDAMQCVHCHAAVGHGERAGLGGRLTDNEKRESRGTP